MRARWLTHITVSDPSKHERSRMIGYEFQVKLRDLVAAVAGLGSFRCCLLVFVLSLFGAARLGRAWVNSTILLWRLPLLVSVLCRWCVCRCRDFVADLLPSYVPRKATAGWDDRRYGPRCVAVSVAAVA
jgi:hypothetical protein